MSNLKKSVSVAIGATFAAGLAATPLANAAENPFGMQNLDSGYMQVAEGKCGESMGAAKEGEGKCGEGKKDGVKVIEAKCGESMGAEKGAEGKCGEGKKDAAKIIEAKCGEAKCGGNK